MPQLFEFENRLITFDDLWSNAGFAERGRTLRQAHETIELGYSTNDVHPGSVVFVEFAIELCQSMVSQVK